MRVIDLLNKIANGEEVPYGIMGGSIPYYYDKDRKDFVGGISNSSYFTCFSNIVEYLNLKVEVIEEDKEIEEINKSYPIFAFDEKSFEAMKDMLQDVYSKQVEIIKKVNELKKGK